MTHEALLPNESPQYLTEIKFRVENSVAYLPKLDQAPVVHGFSWGKDSKNMSFKYSGGEDVGIIRQRVFDFLGSLGIEYSHVFHMLGVFEGDHQQIEEIDSTMLDRFRPETIINGNFIYTKDPKATIVIRPADCPISIIYAKDKDGNPILAFDHKSGVSTNAGISKGGLTRLKEKEGVDLSGIIVGITPGVSRQHFSIPNSIAIENNWGSNIDPFSPEKGEGQRRQVDILRATVMQYLEVGVNPLNIQAYDVDTWQAGLDGLAFSNRYSVESGKPQGRFMVAARLKTT